MATHMSTSDRNALVEKLVRDQLANNPEFQKNLAESVKSPTASAPSAVKELVVKVESTPAPPVQVQLDVEPTKVLVDTRPLEVNLTKDLTPDTSWSFLDLPLAVLLGYSLYAASVNPIVSAGAFLVLFAARILLRSR